MLSVEHSDGTMQLLAHHFESPQHLIDDANQLAEKAGDYAGALVLLDAPLSDTARASLLTKDYEQPKPKRAGEYGR